MNKRIVCQGTPNNILSNTKTEDVARFFELNMLRGKIANIKKDRIIIDVYGQYFTLEDHYGIKNLGRARMLTYYLDPTI